MSLSTLQCLRSLNLSNNGLSYIPKEIKQVKRKLYSSLSSSRPFFYLNDVIFDFNSVRSLSIEELYLDDNNLHSGADIVILAQLVKLVMLQFFDL